MIFNWQASYSVNNTAIDNQHKKLFNTVKHFSIKKASDFIGSNAFDSVYAELLQYASDHFAFEEEYMKSHKYPYLEMHKKKHQIFVIQVKQMKNDMGCDPQVNYKKLVKFMKEWITQHIYVDDRLYSNYIEDKKAKQ